MKKHLLLFIFSFLMMDIFAQNIVITEIYYNAPNSGVDSMEYVEIHNKSAAAINLKNYTFRSAFSDTLPDFSLEAGAYYVVTANAIFFEKATKTKARQWKRGSLNNAGATIQLWSAEGQMIDSVRYRTVTPWNIQANGQGPSLELCDLNSNNDLAASWGAGSTAIGYSLNNQNGQAIALLGTPGKANKCATGTGGGGGGTGTLVIKDINTQTNKNTVVNINIAQPNTLQANTITSSGIVKQATNGIAAKLNGGGGGGGAANAALSYTPNGGFVGLDKFEYFICTANGCDSAIINVRVVEAVFNVSTIGKITVSTTLGGLQPDSTGRFVEIEGVVHSPNFNPTGLQFTLIDQKFKSDGIEIAKATGINNYVVKQGDKLKVRGRVNQANTGITRLVADTLWVLSSGVKEHEPTLVSILDESTENMLIVLNEVSIMDTTKWVTTGTGNFFTVDVSPDKGLTKYQVRIDKDIVELANWKAPKGKFDLVGIGYQNIALGGGGGGGGQTSAYQIMPRSIADFRFTSSANDEVLGQSVRIYPNPFADEMTVVLSENVDKLIIKDMLGRNVLQINEPTNQERIDTKNWLSGIYTISVIKNNRQFVSKIAKF
jgi:hypothetical protein